MCPERGQHIIVISRGYIPWRWVKMLAASFAACKESRCVFRPRLRAGPEERIWGKWQKYTYSIRACAKIHLSFDQRKTTPHYTSTRTIHRVAEADMIRMLHLPSCASVPGTRSRHQRGSERRVERVFRPQPTQTV